jgi:CIC family chloride channel protein
MRLSSTHSQSETSYLAPLFLSVLAVVVGVAAGFGAIAFRDLVALFHNLFLLGKFSFHYDTTAHTPVGYWGAGIIAVPVVGSLVVSFIAKNVTPDIRGSGVPKVLEAIYYKKGLIKPFIAIAKLLASAISIGSGGSVGRESPIIRIGATFGSTVGQIIHMPTWQRNTLIAAGGAAGIAGTFNAPIGGILFAIEILLQEISTRTLATVALAAVSATYIDRIFLGDSPAFHIPGLSIEAPRIAHPETLLLFIGLGLLMGVISSLYIKSLMGFNDLFFQKLKTNDYLRHALGMLGVGLMMYIMMRLTGRYYIQGVGYATVEDISSQMA